MPLNLSLCLTVEKCLRGLTVGSSFVYICIMDQAVGEKKDTGTYFAASTSVEMLFSQPGHNLCIMSQSSTLCLPSFVYPTMPPAAVFLTAPSITMAALYITSDWLTAG